MRLPDSPEDRRRRDDALQRIGRHLAVAAVPCALISVLTHALGVPWVVIVIFLVLVAASIVFQA